MVPPLRITAANAHPVRVGGDYVLYWMIAARRAHWNFALQRAVEHAAALGKPLLVLEALRVDHPWAAVRFHQFVLDGMRDNARAFQGAGVTYLPYLEPEPGAARGLLAALAARAAVVVTDDFPCFFLPRLVAAAARQLPVAVEAVDGNGLLPLRAVSAVAPTAYAFRRALQKELPAHLKQPPVANPLAGLPRARPAEVPAEVATRWPAALDWPEDGDRLRALPIDQAAAGAARLAAFLDTDLAGYGAGRNHPDLDTSSRLSPYLHWGHLSPHEVFHRVMAREGWLGDLPAKGSGAKQGWWGVSAAAESFLDELITWREVGFNFTSKRDDYDAFESLPAWARTSLERHAGDEREHRYGLDAFDEGRTHDPLWNAAQRQLRREGRIHTYLRMLWGKKILEWSATPREALATMIALNNRYALDGRDPNSYSGICWVLGRYDRPWYPERPVFGVVRFMSSANTARKLRVRQYLTRFAASA
jgi:deoxyribodipyrimidine photo-lyase